MVWKNILQFGVDCIEGLEAADEEESEPVATDKNTTITLPPAKRSKVNFGLLLGEIEPGANETRESNDPKIVMQGEIDLYKVEKSKHLRWYLAMC